MSATSFSIAPNRLPFPFLGGSLSCSSIHSSLNLRAVSRMSGSIFSSWLIFLHIRARMIASSFCRSRLLTMRAILSARERNWRVGLRQGFQQHAHGVFSHDLADLFFREAFFQQGLSEQGPAARVERRSDAAVKIRAQRNVVHAHDFC